MQLVIGVFVGMAAVVFIYPQNFQEFSDAWYSIDRVLFIYLMAVFVMAAFVGFMRFLVKTENELK